MGIENIKVMIVDDSSTIRKSAELFLKQAGYTSIILVEDGFEALSAVVDENPDIIFMDILMPKLDGYQTCQLIKNNKIFKKTPVIMLSSKDGVFDIARGRIAGCNEYLPKPFTKEAFLEAIKKHAG